jgi:flagellar biosynthetic protein FliP
MLSELKTAFLHGLQNLLAVPGDRHGHQQHPHQHGMMMLPPVLISLPFKLLLFVLVDGWRLITFHLMSSFS